MNAPPKEWSVLFNAATDGTIDDEGAEALATLLRENAEARRQWYLHCDVELGLAEMGAMRGGPKAISKTPRRRKLAALLIPVAAVVALGFFLAPRDNKRQPVQISVLRTVDTSSQWTAGSRISVERLELETGDQTIFMNTHISPSQCRCHHIRASSSPKTRYFTRGRKEIRCQIT